VAGEEEPERDSRHQRADRQVSPERGTREARLRDDDEAVANAITHHLIEM
jgi:hypothetical protein